MISPLFALLKCSAPPSTFAAVLAPLHFSLNTEIEQPTTGRDDSSMATTTTPCAMATTSTHRAMATTTIASPDGDDLSYRIARWRRQKRVARWEQLKCVLRWRQLHLRCAMATTYHIPLGGGDDLLSDSNNKVAAATTFVIR